MRATGRKACRAAYHREFSQRAAIGGAGAWRGSDLSAESITIELSSSDREELKESVAAIRPRGLATSEMPRKRFSLGDNLLRLTQKIENELHNGRGLVRIRGFPYDLADMTETERLYWTFCSHIGQRGNRRPRRYHRLRPPRDLAARAASSSCGRREAACHGCKVTRPAQLLY